MRQQFETVNEFTFAVTRLGGSAPGPHTVITAGIHGGEHVGILALRELAKTLKGVNVTGDITCIHIANPDAFRSRIPEINLADGKNLNRYFPGNPGGTYTEVLAYTLYTHYLTKGDFYFDLHGGDIHEYLTPYVYAPAIADERKAALQLELAKLLDVNFIVHSSATTGAYNAVAGIAGIPSLLLERGGRGIAFKSEVKAYRDDLLRLLEHIGHIDIHHVRCDSEVDGLWPEPCMHADRPDSPDAFPRSAVIQPPIELSRVAYPVAEDDTFWHSEVSLNRFVKRGERLGYTTDVFGNRTGEYLAEFDGYVVYYNSSLSAPKHTVLVAYGEPKTTDGAASHPAPLTESLSHS